MARINWGTVRIQKTDNQVVAEIWLGERKVTVYMGSDPAIISIDNNGQFHDDVRSVDGAILWLADGIPDRSIEEIEQAPWIKELKFQLPDEK